MGRLMPSLYHPDVTLYEVDYPEQSLKPTVAMKILMFLIRSFGSSGFSVTMAAATFEKKGNVVVKCAAKEEEGSDGKPEH